MISQEFISGLRFNQGDFQFLWHMKRASSIAMPLVFPNSLLSFRTLTVIFPLNDGGGKEFCGYMYKRGKNTLPFFAIVQNLWHVPRNCMVCVAYVVREGIPR